MVAWPVRLAHESVVLPTFPDLIITSFAPPIRFGIPDRGGLRPRSASTRPSKLIYNLLLMYFALRIWSASQTGSFRPNLTVRQGIMGVAP